MQNSLNNLTIQTRRFSLSSDGTIDSNDDLPYPEALPRSDFLQPDFNPTAYLSTLSTRHQTLEDLRSDLRERSQLLSKELLDLVNTNYEDFLNLGLTLRGGEENVEDVRVGLLGFRKGIGEVKDKVNARSVQVQGLLDQRRGVLQEIELGRKLCEVEDRLAEMEARLMVDSLGRVNDDYDDWSDEDDEEEGLESDAASRGVRKLQSLVEEFKTVEELQENVGSQQPFLKGQVEVRMIKVKNTLLLDLGTALKGAVRDGSQGAAHGRLLAIMELFASLGESAEAVRILKASKS